MHNNTIVWLIYNTYILYNFNEIDTLRSYSLRQRNTGWVSSEDSLTSWEDDSALVGHPSSDSVTKTYGEDVLIGQPCTQSSPTRLVKIESELLDQLKLT